MVKKVTAEGEIIEMDIPYKTAGWGEQIQFKTPWNHDRDAESVATGLTCKDPSKAQQQHAKDADINVILAKFLQTNELPQTGAPIYQDMEEEFDLQSQMVTGYQVDEAWNALPTAVRAILGTPKKFVEYVDHCLERGDLEPLRELGLVPLPETADKAAEPTTPPGGAPAPGPSETASKAVSEPPSGAQKAP